MPSRPWRVRETAPLIGGGDSGPAPFPAAGYRVWKHLSRRFYGFVGIVALFALGNSSDMFLLLYAWSLFNLGLIPVVMLWIVPSLSKIIFSAFRAAC